MYTALYGDTAVCHLIYLSIITIFILEGDKDIFQYENLIYFGIRFI